MEKYTMDDVRAMFEEVRRRGQNRPSPKADRIKKQIENINRDRKVDDKTLREQEVFKQAIDIQKEIIKAVNEEIQTRAKKIIKQMEIEPLNIDYNSLKTMSEYLGYTDIFEFMDVIYKEQLSFNELVLLFDDRQDDLLRRLNKGDDNDWF